MAYSTAIQIRNNEYILSLAKSPDLTDYVINDRISIADQKIETDLAKVVTFPLSTTPDYISLLSQYKATELCLVYLYTRKREGKENDDIQYWADKYNILLEKILNGEIDLGDDGSGVNTFSWQSRSNVEPALGEKKYANFKNLEELQEDRPTR